jgi:mutator protein MutT
MTDIVNALLRREGHVLLARRSAARRAYPSCWSFPGGHVEAGESLAEALIRECREEIGLSPTSFLKMGEIADPAPESDVLYHLFAVTAWQGGEPCLVGDEHSELRWVSFATAREMADLALDAYRPLFRRLAER